MNKADMYFKKAIETIINEGVEEIGEVRPVWHDGTPARTKYITQWFETYDLSKGEFPIVTIKPTPFKTALREIIWIYNWESNSLEDAHKLGIKWWDEFESKDIPGTIGIRYGAVVKKYDLMNKLLYDLKNNPVSRRHYINLNQYDCLEESDGLWSCAYETTWQVRGEYLDMHLHQRSNDVALAYATNISQYACLLMMVAHTVGLKPGKFSRYVDNLHIYSRHIEGCKEFLQRKSQETSPTILFNPSNNNFKDYTVDDFQLINYNPQPNIKMEIAL